MLLTAPSKAYATIRKSLTWLMLAELLLASRISGVSGIMWMEVLSASQASVYKCCGGEGEINSFGKASHGAVIFKLNSHLILK